MYTVMANDFLLLSTAEKGAKLSKLEKNLHKKMGGTDRPCYDGFCIIRDCVITVEKYQGKNTFV